MSSISAKRLGSVVALSFAAVLAGGCRPAEEAAASNGGVASPSGDSARESSARPAPHGPTGISPENERTRMRREQFEAATRGLRFDGEAVVVEPRADTPVGGYDAALAAGRQALDANEIVESVARFADAIHDRPDAAAGYTGMGRALLMMGKDDLALAAFRSALRVDDSANDARQQLALTLHRLDRRPEAIEAMNVVVARDPTQIEAHERLAIWHYYEQNYAKAWSHVAAAEQLGHAMPPQFIALLSGQMARPQ